ncbi:MAG TPA: trypsin-like peptidase domain-containing protein [Acidimicrobiales bacterium]|nr:trypsin-like peptidase domain-containing protein [Acidimicrobiales bacterium]
MSVTDQVVIEDPAPDVQPPRIGRLRAAVIGVAAGAVLGGGLAGGLVYARTSSNSPQRAASAATSATTAPSPVPSLAGGGADVRAILTRVEPAVVSITASVSAGRFGRGTAAGTGMVITSDGDVLTNAHVVSGASDIQVAIPDQGTHPATLLGIDEANDVAVLKISDVKDLPTVTLGSSKSLQVGDPVVAVGNALALNGSPTVTTGIVSALDRQIGTEGGSMSHLIQTDAAINPGNSGGPLLDSGGRVVGMNTAVAGDAQNIGFALAVDEITPKLDGLKKGTSAPASSGTTTGGFLGVGLTDTGAGAGITTVEDGSPAAKAGIQAGDVVVQLDNTPIESAAELAAAIRAHKSGDKVRITVQRGTARRTVTATLTSR